ncbi:MAG: hypothetical protein AB7P40_03720 [Chloroflexota bacterium]
MLPCPQLAPGIWLVGHLQESALEDPPWGVERAGHGYIQMGELAYRIAEQANGEQTIDEIAAAVSAVLERTVSARDVGAIISTVLIPQGVIPAPGEQADHEAGDEADDVAAADEPAQPPPIMRGRGSERRPGLFRRTPQARTIGSGPLEAVASFLMWLYWPPVMVVMLGLSLGGLLWLFFIHGLAAAVMQVLTVPVLLLPLAFATWLVLLAQHVGPMVALYSAGARIERLRIVPGRLNPRFIIDIADDYGLSRWTRLVVNLSDSYLQLVLALALCLVASISGAEFLFLAVTIVTLNVLRLLLPFGRPGADRLLADLLLVQQPLQYVEQAFGRCLPAFPTPAHEIPPLKRWGRITIGAYVGLALGVLLAGGLILIWALPTILASVVWATAAHLAAIPDAIVARDFGDVLNELLQSATLLGATFVGAVLFIVRAGRALVHAWTWSRTARQRRLLVSLAALLVTVMLVLVCVPMPAPRASDSSASGAPRSWAGVTFQPLTQASRGTIFDLFTGAPDIESARS